MKWDQRELVSVVRADDLHISVFLQDMAKYGTPTLAARRLMVWWAVPSERVITLPNMA
jgi:hypothetical protein